MKIAMIACPNPVSQFPVSHFIHDQAIALCGLNCHVCVIVPVPYGKEGTARWPYTARNVEIEGIQYYFFHFLSLSQHGVYWFNDRSCCVFYHTIRRIIHNEISPDIIVGHTFGPDGSLAIQLRKDFGIPAVIITHGSDTMVPVRHGLPQYLLNIARQADAIVTVSDFLKYELMSLNPLLPIKTIWNGFALKRCKDVANKIPHSILFVGNLIAQKNADLVIKAYANILSRIPDASLTIIGIGPQREELQQLCYNLHIQDSVAFIGQISNDQVMENMARAHIFCMPSVREGFGIVYLEAMACGCVAIGTKGGGIDGVICNGENGLLIKPTEDDVYEAISRCFSFPDWAEKLASQGRATAIELTWERNAREHLTLYHQIINKRRKPYDENS